MIPACVRQTVRRSDGQTESIMAKTALCIASYADALSKTYNSTFCDFAFVYLYSSVIECGMICRYRPQAMFSGAKNLSEGNNDGPLINDSQFDIGHTVLCPSSVQYKGQNYPPQYFVLDKDQVTASRPTT